MATPFKLIIVLIAENDEAQSALLLAQLERLGVKYYFFTGNGEEALAALRKDLYHVVLTDNVMPGMSGQELIEAIRADPLIRHLKIAMLSGELTSGNDKEEAGLRTFLYQHNVLPVPKEGLDTARWFAALEMSSSHH